MTIRAWAAVALMVVAAQAAAAELPVQVTGASVRATAPGQDTAAVALHLKASEDAKLVAASSPAAQRVEIHIMRHANGMMEMRAVDSLALPANQEVVLGAGSHLMLTGLKRPLKAGEQVRLALTVEFADKRRVVVQVEAPVRPLGHSGDANMPGMPAHEMQGDEMHDHGMQGHHMGDPAH